MKKVFLAAGGTAGHLFPALRLARTLREEGIECVFIGTFPKYTVKLTQEGFRSYDIPLSGFVSKTASEKWRAFNLLISGMRRVWRILREEQPDAICAFGSYVSVPTILTAWMRRVPIVLHEQNVIPGMATRILSVLARRTAVTFAETQKYLKGRRIVITGCPVILQRPKQARDEIAAKMGIDPDRVTIFIFGGSQGSARLNECAVEAFAILREEKKIQIFHAAGESDRARVEAMYKQKNFPVQVFGFFDQMEFAYSVADLVICRAGALTVNELLLFGNPAILVPYPHAGNHQLQNAKVLERSGQACVIEETVLSPQILAQKIKDFWNKETFKNKKINVSAQRMDPAQRLAEVVRECVL